MWTGQKRGLAIPSLTKASAKMFIWDIITRAQYGLGSVRLRSSLAKRDLRVLVDKLNVSQQCASAAIKAHLILDCICRDFTTRDRDTITPFSTVPEVFCLVMSPQFKNCKHTGEIPKEGCEDDQKAGETAV